MRTSRDHGVKIRVPQMLRLLHLVALAIFTVVCVGAAKPAPVYASVGATIELTAPESASATTRWVAAPRSAPQWRPSTDLPVGELSAFEADFDDDDVDGRDLHFGRAHAPAVALRDERSPRPARVFRGESKSDPSRFAIGHVFARGPPA